MGNALRREDPLFFLVQECIPILETVLLFNRRIKLYLVDQLPSAYARGSFSIFEDLD